MVRRTAETAAASAGPTCQWNGRAMKSTTTRQPAIVTFPVTPTWTEVRITLDRFNGADLAQLRGLAFTAGAPAGAFAFEIDDVRLQ